MEEVMRSLNILDEKMDRIVHSMEKLSKKIKFVMDHVDNIERKSNRRVGSPIRRSWKQRQIPSFWASSSEEDD